MGYTIGYFQSYIHQAVTMPCKPMLYLHLICQHECFLLIRNNVRTFIHPNFATLNIKSIAIGYSPTTNKSRFVNVNVADKA